MAVIRGTGFNDILNGTVYSDYIRGDAGNDSIYAGAGADYAFGGDGNDTISDGAGADNLDGGAGDDTFLLDSDATADFVDGGAGFDIITYATPSNVTTVVDFLDNSLNAGAAAGDTFAGIEAFTGSSSKDIAYGSSLSDEFFGSGGNDQYFGRGGMDTYHASALPIATSATLEIAFGSRAATLAAAAGIAAPGANEGVAYYEVWNDANNDGIRDAGEVVRSADLLDSIEVFAGTASADTIRGSGADEWFAPGAGADTVAGGAGTDLLYYYDLGPIDFAGTGVTVDLAAGTATTGYYDNSTFQFVTAASAISGIENVMGSKYSDQLQGNAGANTLYGREGDDALDGRDGADVLYGGYGNDILVGGNFNDVLDGGPGVDILAGGAGVDTASYASAGTAVAVSLLRGQGLAPIVNGITVWQSDSSGDQLTGIENLVGSTFDDQFTGNAANNLIEGRAGKDVIQGCGGNDTIYGESAPNSAVADYVPDPNLTDTTIVDDCGCDPDSPSHDVIESYSDELYGGDGDDKVYGQLGDDTLYGGEGADTLSGGDGNDVVYGGNGNDILDGGIGTDFLYGGAGDDTISGGAGFDVIFGGDGNDTVSYSASPSAVNVDLASFWQSGGDASSDYLSEMMSSLSSGSSPSDVMMSAVFLSLLNSIGATGTESSFTLSIPDVLLGIESVTGSAYDDTLSGNALANTLKGGAGADVIDGRGGNDILYGNAGQDTFVFDTVLNVTTNVDSIMDFSVVDDSVQLDQTIFSVLQTGQLASAAFFQGTSAHDSDDRIIYDSASGNLYYDPDGNGSAAQTVIAHLSTGLALTNADFLVVS